MEQFAKQGYLNEDLMIFYLNDTKEREYELHYHDFHKILIFLNGNVNYYIEGKYYSLNPGDVVLVKAGDIHRPIVSFRTPYERIIIYVSGHFFEKEDYKNLFDCFQYCKSSGNNRIAPDHTYLGLLLGDCMNKLKSSKLFDSKYKRLYEQIHITDLLIHLNIFIKSGNIPDTGYISNEKISDTINFINAHITDDLNIETIASAVYLTPSYLMHLFKAETGLSIMQYISRKRLFLADSLIHNGASKTEACYQSGFKNYAAYYHAVRTIRQ